MDVSWSFVVPLLGTVLLGAVIKGTAGFGFNLVVMPLLLLFVDPKQAVALVVPLTLVLDFSIIQRTWKQVSIRRTIPMTIMAALGIPIGTFALLVAPAAILKIGISAMVLGMAILLFMGFSPRISRVELTRALVGFSGGVLITSTGIGAPPVVLFLMSQKVEKTEFRPALAPFLGMLNFMATVSLFIAGALTKQTLLIDLILLPGVMLGFFIATRIFPHINPSYFRRGVLITVMITALSGIIGALSSM